MAAIDIGSEAINRADSVDLAPGGAPTAVIDYNNPANTTGTITSVEVWLASEALALQIFTCYESPAGTFTVRGSYTKGTATTAGSKQTIAVSLDVHAGDYIGIEGLVDGAVERDTSGFSGIYTHTGAFVDPAVPAAFTLVAGDAISLYGTGVTNPSVKVKIVPQDPYKVQLSPSEPYKVTVEPSRPYTVTISPSEVA